MAGPVQDQLAKDSFRDESFARDDSPKFRRIRDIHQMAAEQRPGDGINPAEERRSKSRGRDDERARHAVERFAGVVESAVSFAISEVDHPILSSLSVASVTPDRSGFHVHLSGRKG